MFTDTKVLEDNFQSLNNQAEKDRIRQEMAEAWVKRRSNTRTTVDMEASPKNLPAINSKEDKGISRKYDYEELHMVERSWLGSPDIHIPQSPVQYALQGRKQPPSLHAENSRIPARSLEGGTQGLDAELPITSTSSARYPTGQKVMARLDVMRQANYQLSKGPQETLDEAPSVEEIDE